MAGRSTPYSIGITTGLPFEDAVSATREALASEGFGILTEIDIRSTLKEKLGIDFPPYLILGACNPPLAHRALSTEPDIGTLLPCNVIVRTAPGGGETIVSAMDPVPALGLAANSELESLGTEVRERLERVLALVGEREG